MKLPPSYISHWLLPVVVVLLASPSGHGQFWSKTKAEKERSALKIDHAYFQTSEPDVIRLELFYQFFHFGLSFVPQEDKYFAEYRLTAVITGKGDKVVAADTVQKTITLASEQRTRSPFDYRASQLNFDLRPGKYKVAVALHDLSSRKTIRNEFKVKLKKAGSKRPSFSSIEFAEAVRSGTATSGRFAKGNVDVIPSVSRAYGGSDSAKLLYYFEIYRGTETDKFPSVLVETRLRHRSKGMVYRDTLRATLDKNVVRQVREMSLNGLPPGQYELEMYLRGRRNKNLAKQVEEFSVAWTPEGMLRHDWKTSLRQLAYIADPGTISKMKKLEDYGERKAAFDDFWDALDPTRGTPMNEFKREFYRRVDVANRSFSALKRDGWKTDRGMIFIRNGRPDELDDVPYAANSVPFQIWEYFKGGEYLRFIFVDENQDGDYRLQYPYDGRGQRPDF